MADAKLEVVEQNPATAAHRPLLILEGLLFLRQKYGVFFGSGVSGFRVTVCGLRVQGFEGCSFQCFGVSGFKVLGRGVRGLGRRS